VIILAKSAGRVPAEVLMVPGRPCHVRGAMLSSHLSWVEKEHGPAGVAAVWARLPERLRTPSHETIAVRDWVTFELLVSVDKAIAKTYATGREESLAIELGRVSARRNFAPLEMARGVNVHSHFWSGHTHHDRFQDFGSCTYVPLEEQAFRMEYREYPVKSRVFCLSAYGYFEESVTLLGGHEPIVEETSCQCYGDEGCTFVVSWER
jgi:hypothetical protein